MSDKKYQIVNINKKEVFCNNCRKNKTETNLIDVGNFEYNGTTTSKSKFFEEACKCLVCGTIFLLHYDLFLKSGHVYPRVFSEEPTIFNNWYDSFSENQKKKIFKHLKNCEKCRDALEEETLLEVRLRNLIGELQNNDV